MGHWKLYNIWWGKVFVLQIYEWIWCLVFIAKGMHWEGVGVVAVLKLQRNHCTQVYVITPKRVRQNTNDTNEYCYIKVNKIQKGGLRSYPFFLRCLYEARKVSDEVHFLIKCSENKVAREQLFLQISQKCKNFYFLVKWTKIILDVKLWRSKHLNFCG